MASKVSTPYMPRLEMLKFPLLNSSGLSCLLRALLTRSAQFLQQINRPLETENPHPANWNAFSVK